MKRLDALGFCLSFLILFYQGVTVEAQPGGFVSIACGAVSQYTDATGIVWNPDIAYTNGGSTANLGQSITNSVPLQTLRYFPGNLTKYCYTIGPVEVSNRYLVRATFLYGDYDNSTSYPTFSISFDASPWAAVAIANATSPQFNEFIAVATSSAGFVVCLLRGQTGNPFISTLELRPLVQTMYEANYLGSNFLTGIARINFGAPTQASVRYPDDPVDRIWVSDQAYPLQGEALSTYPISTNQNISLAQANDLPPEKVMQTAAVGGSGVLSYRINLPSYFPAFCKGSLFFAEIQDLQQGAIREFNFTVNLQNQLYDGVPLDLATDIGSFVAFEPGFKNTSLPAIVEFKLVRTENSTLDPLLNALEIYQILPIVAGTYSGDVEALSDFVGRLPAAETAGDPCLPSSWDFLVCNSDSPPRVIQINLSGYNLTGNIPDGISGMTGLEDLWLDNNQLTGSVPDLSQLTSLQTLHLQNNQLTGPFPSSLDTLDNLTEIYVSNNNLTGTVPLVLQNKQGLLIQATGDPYLCANLTCAAAGSSNSNLNIAAIVGGSVGGVFLLLLLLSLIPIFLWRRNRDKDGKKIKRDKFEGSRFPFQPSNSAEFGFRTEEDLPPQIADGAKYFQLKELVAATENFAKMIGSGGFGPVYYGKTKDDQEIAVKVLSASSSQGAREFFNEVNLLSRTHHRNLVSLIGYCADIKERMLVYEYMHKGSLRDHLHGSLAEDEPLDWLARLNIVLDAAKGLEYLHVGCNPSIIHRDIKSSNILINKKLYGKVADFGLSKLTTEDASAISTTVRGTVGYLDPEYYTSQQLTTKSDVFSFGVVLLEILSGREPIMDGPRGDPDTNLVHYSRGLLQKGDLATLIDPYLGSNYRQESLWKLAELALRSVEPYGRFRPTMSETVLELQEIINIELEDSNSVIEGATEDSDSDSFRDFAPPTRTRTHSRARTGSLSPSSSYMFDSSSMAPLHSGSLDDLYFEPIAR